MVAKSKKTTPSELDFNVWRMKFIENRSRSEIAQVTGKAMTTIDYHIGEAKRLVGVDVSKVKTDMQSLMVPVALDSLKTIAKTMSKHNPKYVDAAIKFLRNAGYTIEQQEVTHVLKDSRNTDEDFAETMKRFKAGAIDVETSDKPTDHSTSNTDQSAKNDEPGTLDGSTPTSNREKQ